MFVIGISIIRNMQHTNYSI